MPDVAQSVFNPCLLGENQRNPAKIWELLRRNDAFGRVVRRLAVLDEQAKENFEKTRQYHGDAWSRSWRLLKGVNAQNSFAGTALQWLVPEPLFLCNFVSFPRGKKLRNRKFSPLRFLRIGHGLTPNVKDGSWVWHYPNTPSNHSYPLRRGPQIELHKSKFKQLRSKVNPISEWSHYKWPFTINHSWADAPHQFQREFHFIWRRYFDCRSTNPITGDRNDSPEQHETTFFQDWNLEDFQRSGKLAQDDLYQIIRFQDLARNYRVFAIPKTVITKAIAEAMGRWVTDALKAGSTLYGGILKSRLLNEGDLFGTIRDWCDWLERQAQRKTKEQRDTHFYSRCIYMDSLVQMVYPTFQIDKLLRPALHRAHGKKYVRKK
jgi:hypothetical protein